MIESLSKQLAGYTAFFPEEEQRMRTLIAALDSKVHILDRKTSPGHITASGIVLRENCLLMIRHPTLGKWLQPGGHVENGETPLQAAIREVREETGVCAEPHSWHKLQPFPIDIDIHRIPANERKSEPAHVHYDFRYILIGSASSNSGEHPMEWKEIFSIEETGLGNLMRKIEELKIEE